MPKQIENFFSISRDIRYNYECYQFTNQDKYAVNILNLIRELRKSLYHLKNEIIEERKMVLLYESEYKELEELLLPTLKRTAKKIKDGTKNSYELK